MGSSGAKRRRIEAEQKASGVYCKGLHHRRTAYRPGWGICHCSTCAAVVMAHREARDFGSRFGEPVEGCAYINREKVFAELWAAEHAMGKDLAQGLMQKPPKPGQDRGWDWRPIVRGPVAFVLCGRERVIIATIIQWLGSNIGFDFLRRALDRCGYEIKLKGGPDGLE